MITVNLNIKKKSLKKSMKNSIRCNQILWKIQHDLFCFDDEKKIIFIKYVTKTTLISDRNNSKSLKIKWILRCSKS